MLDMAYDSLGLSFSTSVCIIALWRMASFEKRIMPVLAHHFKQEKRRVRKQLPILQP